MKPYRRKFALIAERPDVTLRVVTPMCWYESFQDIIFQPEPDTACEECPCPIRFSGYGSRFYYRHGIKSHFKDFQPDIIHLEEEAWSLNALQTVRLKRKYCPNSRFIFRTSLSIPTKQRFGILPVWIERAVFRETDRAFPLSENAGKILTERGYTGKQTPFPNGVDVRHFYKMDVTKLRDSLELSGCFVVGYVGRLLQMKGIDTLLQALAYLATHNTTRTYKLLIVGQGKDKDRFVKKAETLGISEQIVWIDAVPPEEVAAYINCMDTIVLPSRTTTGWVEFFGRVLIEGMACKVPVIGSDSGEIPHVIDDAGLVFPEADTDALAERIYQIAHDVHLRNDLVARGLDRIKNFTWETIAERTYQVYQELLREAKK
ncbi:glycosyltransferase family 4 protein [Candidatus Poribacteria bacterium]|nr:glycosyltransferase family 4 protein [Candidatus Poribacteria bacterium]MYA98745.1 glycosyltransferase family 4 protein [Candidatus Poribacteria bacterium]